MRRVYSVHGGGFPELVLDVSLCSASMEHLSDRCGHKTLFLGDDGYAFGLETRLMSAYTNGVYLLGTYTNEIYRLPYWQFDPVCDARYSYSWFGIISSNRGHGWAWELFSSNIGEPDFSVSLNAALSFTGGTKCRIGGVEFLWADLPMLNRLRFFTVVVDGTKVSVFIDGYLVGTGDNPDAALPFDKAGIRCRPDDSQNNAAAIFRQFKLFRNALSPNEVAALYVYERELFSMPYY